MVVWLFLLVEIFWRPVASNAPALMRMCRLAIFPAPPALGRSSSDRSSRIGCSNDWPRDKRDESWAETPRQCVRITVTRRGCGSDIRLLPFALQRQ
jgi:hypothetical protein